MCFQRISAFCAQAIGRRGRKWNRDLKSAHKCKISFTFIPSCVILGKVKLTLRLERRRPVPLQTKIQEFRKTRGVTQSELADAVDVTRQTIISLENGKYNASLLLAHRIARYFGVAIEEIFLFDEEESI